MRPRRAGCRVCSRCHGELLWDHGARSHIRCHVVRRKELKRRLTRPNWVARGKRAALTVKVLREGMLNVRSMGDIGGRSKDRPSTASRIGPNVLRQKNA
eukprot:1757858-Pleurochrysis_carterae.AAC.1